MGRRRSLYDIVKGRFSSKLKVTIKDLVGKYCTIQNEDTFTSKTSTKLLLLEFLYQFSQLQHPFDLLPLRILVIDVMVVVKSKLLLNMNSKAKVKVVVPKLNGKRSLLLLDSELVEEEEESYDVIIIHGFDLYFDGKSQSPTEFIKLLPFDSSKDGTVYVLLRAGPCKFQKVSPPTYHRHELIEVIPYSN